MVRNSSANAGDAGDVRLIPGSRTSPEEGNGNPLQYSCLENPMDRGAWRAIGPQGCEESDMTEQPHTHSQICMKLLEGSFLMSHCEHVMQSVI